MSDRLYRSRHDRMLAGVAGGLADLWDADPSLIRIIWAILVIPTGGIAFLVYIIMAIVVPEEDADVEPRDHPESPAAGAPIHPASAWLPDREARRAARLAGRAQAGPGVGPILIGSVLVLLGVYFLVREYIPEIDWNWFWPLVLVGVGVVVLVKAIGRGPGDDQQPQGGPGAPG